MTYHISKLIPGWKISQVSKKFSFGTEYLLGIWHTTTVPLQRHWQELKVSPKYLWLDSTERELKTSSSLKNSGRQRKKSSEKRKRVKSDTKQTMSVCSLRKGGRCKISIKVLHVHFVNHGVEKKYNKIKRIYENNRQRLSLILTLMSD